MDLQRKQLLNHHGNDSGQTAEHPTLRLQLRAPVSCNTQSHQDGTGLVSLHRACSWLTCISCHKTGWGTGPSSGFGWWCDRSSQEGLKAVCSTQAMWHQPKIGWDTGGDPLWPISHILLLVAVFSLSWELVWVRFFFYCPPKLTQVPHWEIILGSKGRDLPSNTWILRLKSSLVHFCHPKGLQTLNQSWAHCCSSYWWVSLISTEGGAGPSASVELVLQRESSVLSEVQYVL